MKDIQSYFRKIGYPESWLMDMGTYLESESYVAFDPSWEDPIPEIPNVSIYDLFKKSAEKYPERAAISF